MIAKGDEVLAVLSSVFLIEWARFHRNSGLSPGPPLTVVRFASASNKRAEDVVRAIKSFKGQFKWTCVRGSRNWVIQPEVAERHMIQNNFRVDAEAAADFAKKFPEEVQAAYVDQLRLAQHLRRELEAGRS